MLNSQFWLTHAARKLGTYTDAELGRKLSLSRVAVHRTHHGKTALGVSAAARLAEALDLPILLVLSSCYRDQLQESNDLETWRHIFDKYCRCFVENHPELHGLPMYQEHQEAKKNEMPNA